MNIFDKLLPSGVEVIEAVERGPGVTVSGAYLNNALVNYIQQGPVQPLNHMSFTIGVGGRGTLNIPGSEFMDLLASMIITAKLASGLLTEAEPSDPAE